MSQKIKILFPIDFSELADDAFDTAQYLCKVYDAELFILHVLEAPSGPARLFSSFDEGDARKKATAHLDEYINRRGDKEIVFHKVIKIGKPYKAIVEAATEIEANAIVMGTHGASGISEVLAGSNASRTIKTAPCPVITIRNKPDHLDFKRILLPIDLSKESGEKLELGVEFAQNFGGELVVLTVLQSVDDDVKARLDKRMTMAREHIEKKGVPVSTEMVISKDKVGEAVVKYAGDHGVDLICIMTQQEGGNFREAVLGSEAAWIVNHSDIPVLAIKPKRVYHERRFTDSHFG